MDYGNVMAKKELKTEVKRLRLTELEAKQLEKYLDDHDLTFSEFVNAFIGQKIMSEFPTVLAEPLDVTADSKKSKSKIARQPPKTDPALLFQIGKIGNNLNQVARSLNLIQKDKKLINDFSFFECLHTLSLIQSDIHEVIGDLPKITRTEEAVSRARERALKKSRGEVLDVH